MSLLGPDGQPISVPKPSPDQPNEEHVTALFQVMLKKIADGGAVGMALVSAQEALCQLYARICVARGVDPVTGGRDFLARFPQCYAYHAKQIAEEVRRRGKSIEGGEG